MAEYRSVLEKLRQKPGFDKLPTHMREDLIRRELEIGLMSEQPVQPGEAAKRPWWQGATEAMTGGGLEGGSGLPPGLPPEALKAGAKETIAGGIDMALTAGGTALGTATSPVTGPFGPYIGGIGGSYGAQKINEALGLRDPNARLQLGPVDVSHETLSWAVPAVLGAPGLANELVFRPLAKSSVVGQTAVQEATKRDYMNYQEKRGADITQVKDANTALRQGHEAAKAARQAEIDRLTAINNDAKKQHGTLKEALESQNVAAWKVREDAIEARQREIDRITADNAKAASDYETARLIAHEKRIAEEQINKDAKMAYDATVAARLERWRNLDEAKKAFTNAKEHKTTLLDLDAKAAQAANPAKARTMLDDLPDIPTKEAVDDLYDTLDTTLQEHNIALTVPEYRAAQAEIKKWAEDLAKFPRGEDFEAMITTYTKGLDTKDPITLREMAAGRKFLGNQVRILRKRANTGAGDSIIVTDELKAAVKAYGALDDSFLKAAEKLPEASEVRSQLLDANEAFKRRAVYEDLTDFWDEVITVNQRGEEVINPVQALKKLESPGYAVTKRFLQRTPVDKANPGGMTMYDKTVETLKKMIPEQMTVQQRMLWYAEIRRTGDPRGKLYDLTMPYTPRPSHVPMRPPLPKEYMTQVPPEGGAPQQPVPERIAELTRHDYAPEPPAPIPQPTPAPIPNLNEALLARVPEAPPSWAEQLQHGGQTAPGRVVGQKYRPAKTGPLPPIRQGVGASIAQYGPHAALGAGGYFVDKAFPGVIPGGMSGAVGVGATLGIPIRQSLAALLMKPTGQDLLVKLIEGRGLRLDPVITGIINTAVRQGVSYGLPMDTGVPSQP